jgi:hypothetical protein
MAGRRPLAPRERLSRPLSVKLVAWYFMVVGGCVALVALVEGRAQGLTTLFGFPVIGAAAFWYNFAYQGLVPVVLGWNIWRLREWARKAMLAMLVVWFMDNQMEWLNSGAVQQHYWAIRHAGRDPALWHLQRFLTSLVMMAFFCWVLHTRRGVFALRKPRDG